MSVEPVSQFIVPQKEPEMSLLEPVTNLLEPVTSLLEPFVSGSEPASESSSDVDVAQLEAALEAVRASDARPVGSSVVDAIIGFFAAVVSLLKYIFRSLSDGIGVNEFQFGYIILGLGALFMTLPLWGEPRLNQGPLPRNSRIPVTYTPRKNNANPNLEA